jgi:hypothetical protein
MTRSSNRNVRATIAQNDGEETFLVVLLPVVAWTDVALSATQAWERSSAAGPGGRPSGKRIEFRYASTDWLGSSRPGQRRSHHASPNRRKRDRGRDMRRVEMNGGVRDALGYLKTATLRCGPVVA